MNDTSINNNDNHNNDYDDGDNNDNDDGNDNQLYKRHIVDKCVENVGFMCLQVRQHIYQHVFICIMYTTMFTAFQ